MSSETCTPTNPSNLGWSSSDTLSSRIQTRTTGRFNFHARKLFIFSLFDKRATDSSFRHSCGIRGRGNQYKPGHPASRPPFLTLFAGSKEGGKQKNRVSSSRRVSDILYRRFWHVWRSRTITQIPHRGPLQSQGPTCSVVASSASTTPSSFAHTCIISASLDPCLRCEPPLTA